MRYYIRLFNERADEMIEARVDARTPEEAIECVFHNPEALKVIQSWNLQDIKTECYPIEDAVFDRERKDRFLLQPSKEKSWYVLTDTKLLITLRFRAGDFNGSQKVTHLDDSRISDPMDIAISLRLMGDWMQKYHRELI